MTTIRALATGDLLPVTLDDQVAAVRRELLMRERVYPRQVSAGRLRQSAADRELAVMRAVLETLLHLQGTSR